MAISCPRCGTEYDVALFPFGARLTCACGTRVDALDPHTGPIEPSPDRRAMEELRRKADGITTRLLHADRPVVDLEIAIEALRDEVRRRMPDRLWLFDRIYVARWRRLRDQGWARGGP